ncbi:hypothetical protein C7999DRAFT_35266 [Corynascus novoguineensis]|uniref:Uncharacterized protein n=1 Tax=Corynascus novoguineensis TaxID=1126955 RepID=A0AAN7HGC9_9PEZI|nr:hypothetical protein C7999DRAFT_35266 [Corynascus novoguineensis]
MRQYWDHDEFDASDDEVLEDAPPAQEPAQLNHGLLDNNWQQQYRLYPSVFGPSDQTTQVWRHQQQGQQRPPGYENWVQNREGILGKDIDEWDRGQRRRLEEQREALYHLYCEAEKVRATLLTVHEERQQQQQLQPINILGKHTPPRMPSPLPRRSSRTTGGVRPEPQQQQEQLGELTHAQKILHLLVYTTHLRQAVRNTASLVFAREGNPAPAFSFFQAVDAAVDRVTDWLDTLWRAAHRADMNCRSDLSTNADADAGLEPPFNPRLLLQHAGTRQEQIEFCAAWERVVDSYGEVVRREEVVFAGDDDADRASISTRGSSMWGENDEEEEWRKYWGVLGGFGEMVGAFAERLKSF